MKLLSILSMCLFMLSCATSNFVREPIGNQQAIVKLGVGNIKAGDRVDVFKETCREVYRRNSSITKCSKTSVGQASVLELKSQEEAIIKADNGVSLEQGLLVEKISQ